MLLSDIPWFILEISSAASSVMCEDCDSDLAKVRILCPSFSIFRFPKIFKISLEMCQSFDQELFQSNRIQYKNESFSRTPLSIQFHLFKRYQYGSALQTGTIIFFFAIAPSWNARVQEADWMFEREKSMWFSLVLQQCVDLSWSRLCREVSWDSFPAVCSSIASYQLRFTEAGYHVGHEPCQKNHKALTTVAINQCGEGYSIDQAVRTSKHQLSELYDSH